MGENKTETQGRDFFRVLKENKKAAAGACIALLAAAAVLVGVLAGNGAKETSVGVTETVSEENVLQEESETQQTVPETAGIALEQDAYPQINELMQTYYQAAADGDAETLQAITDSMEEDILIYLQKRSAYIEAYQDLSCYTKAGPEEGSFVVYASYEVKFQDVDTLVPGISPFLVRSRDDGSLYIDEGEVEEGVNAYLEEVSAQDDVVDLMNLVQVRFNEAVTADEELSDFLAQMTEELKVEVGEALAEAEAAQEEAQDAPQSGLTLDAEEVRAREVVNVRASDSEQADRIGKLQIGDVLKVIESRANGWTKVEYKGKEGFVKSEYLEPVGEETEGGEEAPADGNASGEDGAAALPASGTVTVAETVNVRKSPDEKAERIGVCYQGGKLEILQQQADGWTKVRFEGKTGYVKTAVLKILR